MIHFATFHAKTLALHFSKLLTVVLNTPQPAVEKDIPLKDTSFNSNIT